MTPIEVAEILEGIAVRVRALPGVSRRNPHAFAEAKSELAGALLRDATALRTAVRVPAKPVRTDDVRSRDFRDGPIQVAGRRVLVETRRSLPASARAR